MNPPPPKNQGGNPGGNPLPPEVRVIYDAAPFNDLVNAIKDQYANQESQNEKLIRAVEKNKPIDNDRHPRTANNIAIAAGIVNFIIAAATVMVMIYTIGSVNVARDALADGREKDALNRTNDSIAEKKRDSLYQLNRNDIEKRYRLDSENASKQIEAMQGTLVETRKQFDLSKRAFDSTNEYSKRRFKMDSENMARQIEEMQQTIDESKRQFQINSTARITLDHIRVDSITETRNKWVMSFSLENMGGADITILDYRFAVNVYRSQINERFTVGWQSYDSNWLNETYKFTADYPYGGNLQDLRGGRIIRKGENVPLKFISWEFTRKEEHEAWKDGHYVIFYGYIDYENRTLSKTLRIRFVFTPPNRDGVASFWFEPTYEVVNGKEIEIKNQ
jgi:hypothetical protein